MIFRLLYQLKFIGPELDLISWKNGFGKGSEMERYVTVNMISTY